MLCSIYQATENKKRRKCPVSDSAEELSMRTLQNDVSLQNAELVYNTPAK